VVRQRVEHELLVRRRPQVSQIKTQPSASAEGFFYILIPSHTREGFFISAKNLAPLDKSR
jgi:hypothetical protein